MRLIMSLLDKRTAVFSLRALQRKVTIETLAALQSLLLLQMLMGVSQTVNSSVSRSRALARTLLLNGQQSLRGTGSRAYATCWPGRRACTCRSSGC